MKTGCSALFVVLLLGQSAPAQVIVPGLPGKFNNRPIGGGGSGTAGIRVEPKRSGKVKYTTHIILSDTRTWTSSEGKPLEAKLLAFEDLVVEVPEGAAQPASPKPPPHPTVVRNDKIRLLPANNKPTEVALTRFSQKDRDFVEQLRKAHAGETPEGE